MRPVGFEPTGRGGAHDPRYAEFFHAFNAGSYYEAHDVLEPLWLETSGPDRDFYKALIQLAGAFHHLTLQSREPAHRIHGRRMAPAERLLRRSAELLAPYAPDHRGISVADVRALALEGAGVAASGTNPLVVGPPPRLREPR